MSSADQNSTKGLNGVSILVVDDDALPRRALERTLVHDGWRVRAVEGPAAALGALEAEPFQIVISDHLMPDLSGVELLRIIHERYPQVVRVISTGSADPQELLGARATGDINLVLQKPWSLAEVREVVEQAKQQLPPELVLRSG